MLITFDCPQCKSKLEISAVAVGTEVTCPHCQAAITVPSQGLGPGTTIGGFRIERKLGEGGMGEVYLARQLSMDRDVALKILPSHMGLRQDNAERFLNELKLLAKLNHPHIVAAYDAGSDSGIQYFAMAYMPGESLGEKIQREQMLGEQAALGITRKLAGALAYAWNKHKLLHRDIKPSNVIMDEDGEPKLVDFGLAKSLTAKQGLTMTSMMMGTPNYMSPEQVNGAATLDAGADMYSLGATLYNMLTGQIPFGTSSVMDVLKKQMTESLADPRECNPDVSEGCVALLEIMLSKAREQRHTTWEAVISDIDWVLTGQAPTRTAPVEGHSTLIRIRDNALLAELKKKTPKAKHPVARPRPMSKAVARRNPALLLAVGGAVLLGVVIGGLVLATRKAGPSSAPVAGPSISAVTSAASAAGPGAAAPGAALPAEDRDTEVGQALGAVLEYEKTHAEDYGELLVRLDKLAKEAAGTKYAARVGQELARVRARKKADSEHTLALLRVAVERKAAAGQFAEAEKAAVDYTGAYAAETVAERADLARWVKGKAAEQAQARAAQAAAARQQMNSLLDDAAGDILKHDLAGAATRLRRAQADAQFAAVSNELAAAEQLAQGLGEGGELIMKSFESQKGQAVRIQLRNGTIEAGTVLRVAGNRVVLQQALSAGTIEKGVGLAELSLGEKQRRVGDVKSPETLALRGLLALEGKDRAGAEALLAEAGTLEVGEKPGAGQAGLAAALARVLKTMAASQPAMTVEQREAAALGSVQELLKLAGVTNVTADLNLAQAVVEQTYSSNQVVKIQAAAAEFRKQHGETAAAKTNAALLEALAAVSVTPPGFMTVDLAPATGSTGSPQAGSKQGVGVKLELVWIKPGEFMMGVGADKHQVRLSKGFWMGKYEVTQEQWEKIMGSNPSNCKKSGLTAPVDSVSWDECQEFLRKLNKRIEKRKCKLGDGVFRLPTEAQWEYACRAGTETTFYAGNSGDDLFRVGWYSANADTSQPVGQKEPNAWGLYDMHGNVTEWCEDFFAPYSTVAATDPVGPSKGAQRMARGGSFYGDAGSCPSARRGYFPPASRRTEVGFRVVVR